MRKTSKILTTLGAAVVFAGMSMPAQADTGADGFPILAATQDGLAHHCEVIGSDWYGNQAVICADLSTFAQDEPDSIKNVLTPWVEAYCLNSSGATVQCANIKITAEYADGSGGRASYGPMNCGHSYGACPSGRMEMYGVQENTWDNDPDCGQNPNADSQVWNLVLAGASNTQIELPQSDDTVTLDTNFSTGHYYICTYSSGD